MDETEILLEELEFKYLEHLLDKQKKRKHWIFNPSPCASAYYE